MMKETQLNEELGIRNEEEAKLYQLDGMPKFKLAFPLALQHFLMMFVGTITPAILIGNAAQVTPAQMVIMVQAVIFVSGLATLCAVYPIKIGKLQIGPKLPVVYGTSAVFTAPAIMVAERAHELNYQNVIGIIFGGLMVAALAEGVVGIFYKQLKKFFPPIVIGCVLISTGLHLLTVGAGNLAGGRANADFGSPQNLAIGFTVFFTYVLLTRFGKGLWKISAMLIAMAVGYGISVALGIVDFSAVGQSRMIAMPMPFALGIELHGWAITSFIVIFLVSGLSTIGYTAAICSGGLDREATAKETSSALLLDSLSSSIGAMFGAMPSSECGQNAGLVSMTKLVNRWIIGLCGLLLVGVGMSPQLAAIFAAIPPAVLGGSILPIFAMILNNGIMMVAQDGFSQRNLAVLGMSFAIGLGFAGDMGATAYMPGIIQFFFRDRIALIAICSIIFNLLFPEDKKPAVNEDKVVEENA